MSAEHPIRRERSAREVAKQLGVSIRTVKRVIAEPREQFLSRADERRTLIRSLREQGMTYRAIADQVGCSIGTVHNALKRDEAA